jgi:hypothetical protein
VGAGGSGAGRWQIGTGRRGRAAVSTGGNGQVGPSSGQVGSRGGRARVGSGRHRREQGRAMAMCDQVVVGRRGQAVAGRGWQLGRAVAAVGP